MRAINLFVPLLASAPGWLRVGSSNGELGLTCAWPSELDFLADHVDGLCISSCNRSGRDEQVTAAGADAEFEGSLLVLDGDAFRDATRPQGSSTILRCTRDGALTLVRSGIHDRGMTSENFLRTLADDRANEL